MTVQPRQLKGTPVGGEFATVARAETGTSLGGRPHEHDTPREVDEQLADLYASLAKTNAKVTSRIDSAHHRLGHRKSYARSRAGQWTTGPAETLEQLRSALDAGQFSTWDSPQVEGILTAVEELRDEVAGITGGMRELNGEFEARGGWSRFFLVTSSAGGHIHSSMSCHTCKLTTEYGWQPQLSGKAEPDAVAEHGAILCTACYPTAPVEWTRGKDTDSNTCLGSNQHPATESRRIGRSVYVACPVCGELQLYGYSGVRKHKRKA